jgi:hypothetical protein
MTWMSVATSDWDGYTVFSVIAGISLVILAFLPDQKPGNRVINGVVGLGYVVYGVWAAQQTSGTYFFPVAIFVIPFAVGIKAISGLVMASNQRTRAAQGFQPPGTPGPAGPYPGGVRSPVVASTPRVHPSPSAAQLHTPVAPPQPNAPVMATQHAVPPVAPAVPPPVQLAPPPVSPPLVVTPPIAAPPAASGPQRIVISYDDLD